jgi:hypothetical protein
MLWSVASALCISIHSFDKRAGKVFRDCAAYNTNDRLCDQDSILVAVVNLISR